MSDPETAYSQLREHVETLGAESPDVSIDLSRELLIICGDDGQQVAYRGTCPKCGGESWVPAGKVTLAHLREFGEDTLNRIRAILNPETEPSIDSEIHEKGTTPSE